VTYFSGEIPHHPVLKPFDGAALLSAARPAVLPGSLPTAGIPAGIPAGMATPTTEAVRQPAAAIIQRCYRWLEAAVPMLPQVAALVTVLVTAVQQYAAQQYAACLQQVAVVAQTVQRLRATVPALPPL
jgi:hypothetical protein